MIKSKNKNGEKVRMFYSKYGFKQGSLVTGDIKFQGNINDCPVYLLEGIPNKSRVGVKYILIWN